MLTKSLLWKAAKESDDGYKAYKFRKTETCLAVEKLPPEFRAALYGLLEPNPEKRIDISEVLNGEWMKGTEKCSIQCTSSSDGSRFMHRHAGPG
jgi:serine/threonine protein kinase